MLEEIGIYEELKQSLQNSFDAFVNFQRKARKEMQLSGIRQPAAAMYFPGWKEYVETVALPLNRKTYQIIARLALLPNGVPYALHPFIAYHQVFEDNYQRWKRGEKKGWGFTAGSNFPPFVEEFVSARLNQLKFENRSTLSATKEKEHFMSTTLTASAAFLTGLAAAFTIDHFLAASKTKNSFSISFAGGTALDDLEDGEETDNVTTDDINASASSAALIDGLKGLTVSGADAKLLRVRVLDIERAKAVAMWGSKGVGGNEATSFRLLADLDTDHLVNIRDHSSNVTEDELKLIHSILEDRVAAGEADESVIED